MNPERAPEEPSSGLASTWLIGAQLASLVAAKVEARGDLEVDGISGATTSARGILLAASRALERP